MQAARRPTTLPPPTQAMAILPAGLNIAGITGGGANPDTAAALDPSNHYDSAGQYGEDAANAAARQAIAQRRSHDGIARPMGAVAVQQYQYAPGQYAIATQQGLGVLTGVERMDAYNRANWDQRAAAGHEGQVQVHHAALYGEDGQHAMLVAQQRGGYEQQHLHQQLAAAAHQQQQQHHQQQQHLHGDYYGRGGQAVVGHYGQGAGVGLGQHAVTQHGVVVGAIRGYGVAQGYGMEDERMEQLQQHQQQQHHLHMQHQLQQQQQQQARSGNGNGNGNGGYGRMEGASQEGAGGYDEAAAAAAAAQQMQHQQQQQLAAAALAAAQQQAVAQYQHAAHQQQHEGQQGERDEHMREEEEEEEEYDAEAAWIQKARSGQYRRGSTERAEQRAQAAAAAAKEGRNSYGGWHPSREEEEEDDDEEGGGRGHHHHHQTARRPVMNSAERPMRVPTGYRTKFRSSAEGEPEEERAHTFR